MSLRGTLSSLRMAAAKAASLTALSHAANFAWSGHEAVAQLSVRTLHREPSLCIERRGGRRDRAGEEISSECNRGGNKKKARIRWGCA